MNYYTITKKGQVTIPKKYRKYLGITTPDKVYIELNKKKKRIEIVATPNIMDLAGTFKPKNPINPVKLRGYMAKNYVRR